MTSPQARGVLVSIVCALGALLTSRPANAQNIREGQPSIMPSMEEIYIARSVRESITAPTQFCSQPRIGFAATNEEQFTFRSTATHASDGRVLDANVQTIGSIHVCFGQTSDPAVTNFYGEGRLGSVPFKGIGECHVVKLNFPEEGLSPLRCFLDLSGLPPEYVGGELTTNTILSRKLLGTETEPAGYTQASIATIRLWKKRQER
jgi:hypothetical protein